MSSRIDDAVGGREDPAQPARGMLLVGGEVVQDRLERVGERLGRELERVEQPADPLGAFRRRDAAPRPRSGVAARSPYATASPWSRPP